MSESEQTFAYEFGDWVVEPDLNRIRRGDEEIQLEPRTLDVLRYLLDRPGEIVSIEELLDTVWAGRVVEQNAIHRNINRIRQALGDNPRAPTYIETISKRGYRAIASVARIEVAQPVDSRLVAELEAITPPFPAYEGEEPYVFVCYSHDDREKVYRELVRLRDSGINVWYDEGISIGGEWSGEIGDAIAGCTYFLYFVSPRSVESTYCLDEVHLAREERKRLVPVFLERTTLDRQLQMSIGRFQALPKYSMSESEYARKLLGTLGLYSAPASTVDWWLILKRVLAGAAAFSIIIGIGAYLTGESGVGVVFDDPLENSIKVAPFKDNSPTHNDGWIGDSIESRLRYEAPASGIQVVGSPSNWDAGESRYVLEGSVIRVGDQVQVSALLISVEDAVQVWAEIYRSEYKTDLNPQHEIVAQIVTAVADQMEVVGTPTLIATKPEDQQTGALQGVLDTAPTFDGFPSFEEGEGDE